MYTAGSFVNLEGISEQNHLQKHVRKIVNEQMWLENMDKEEWIRDMRVMFRVREDMGSEVFNAWMDELQTGWKVYKSIVESQLALTSANTDCHILSDVLRKFSGLEEMVISGRPDAGKSPWLKRICECPVVIAASSLCGGIESDLRCVRGMINGLEVAEMNDVHLKSLRITGLGGGLFDYPPVHIDAVFRRLRTLKLSFVEDLAGTLEQRHRNLGNLLKSARQLESLDIKFGRPTTHKLSVFRERWRSVPVY